MFKTAFAKNRLLNSTSITRIKRATAVALAGVLTSTAPALAINDNALPTGGTVASGDASFNYSSNQLDVNQSSDRVVIDWNSFNIGKDATTQFYQPGSSSVAVNRVNDIDPSVILGNLRANGKLVILNTNGVFFGQSAHVDVSGLVASTGKIDADAFMNDGSVKLSGINAVPGAKVENQGNITIQNAGLAAFVAPEVVNSGIINAHLGKIALASGSDKATVDLYGDGLVEMALDDAASKALIKNDGTLKADGGVIAVTAKAAQGLVDSVINMGGIVEANSVGMKNGKIVLGATNADIKVTGKINAKGGNGEIKATSNQNITVDAGAELNADAGVTGNGGVVTLVAEKHMDFRGVLTARGGTESGNGGSAEISGKEYLGFTGLANLGADNGEGGSLLLDPTFAIIHSGVMNNPLGLGYILSAQALANSMETGTTVTVQASDYIDVGTKKAGYNTGNVVIDAILNGLGDANIDLSTFNYNTFGWVGPNWYNFGWINHTGTTQGTLKLQTDTVNFNRDMKLGNGNLNVAANTVNLDAKLSDIDGLLDQSDITTTASVVNVVSPDAYIQQGIYLSKNGGTVNVGHGNYFESVNIAKSVALKGAGTVTSTHIIGPSNDTGTGITIAADNVSLSGIVLEGWYNGLAVNSAVNNLSMDDIVSRHNSYAGFHVSNSGSINGLTVSNSHFDDNNVRFGATNDFGYGWYFAKGDNNPANTTNVTNVTVTDTTFSGNTQKGIYAEKLDNAHFTNVDVINSGTRLDNPFGNAGIDLNLKNGNYSNISFDNLTISGSGLNSTTRAGYAFIAKGRNDGATYSLTPGSLTNLDIINSDITAGGTYAVVFSNNITDATLQDSTISGPNAVTVIDGVSNAKIVGNTITDTYYGVYINGGNDHNVEDNIVDGGTFGIYFGNTGTDNSIIGNTVGQTTGTLSNAITVTGNTGLTNIQGNHVYNTGWDGIQVTNGTGFVNILSNDIHNTTGASGIAVMNHGGDALVENNVIDGTDRLGIYVQNSNGLEIKGNTISDTGREPGWFGAGIHLEGANNTTVDNNTIDKTGTSGIYVGAGNNPVVTATTGNVIKNNKIGTTGGANNIHGDGIYASSSNGIQITGNTINETQYTTPDANGSNGSGIQVVETNGATINNNTITNADWDGIRLQNDSNVTASGNSINTTGRVGIWGGNISTATISNNLVKNDGLGGYGSIHADGGSNWTVSGNQLQGGDYAIFLNGTGGTNLIDSNLLGLDYAAIAFTADGIRAVNTSGLTVSNNNIGGHGTYTMGDGIHIENSAGAQIKNNGLLNVQGDDIYVVNSDNALVSNNSMDSYSFKNGIHIVNSDNVQVLVNNVGTFATHGNANSLNGILIEGGSDSATVDGNSIYLSKLLGISGIVVNGGTNQKVTNNTVNGTTRGIWLQNTGAGAVVTGNTIGQISGSSSNGIELLDTADVTVSGNHIYNAGWDGVHVTGNTGLVTVSGNDIHNTVGASGIAFVFGGAGGSVVADGNTIENSARLGIYVGQSDNATIKNNTIKNSGTANTVPFKDGIFIEASDNALIDNNTIDGTSGDGIRVGGSGNWAPTSTTNITVSNNKIGQNGGGIAGNGISIIDSAAAQVTGNQIAGVGGNGIFIDPSNGSVISGNTITDAVLNGIYSLNNSDVKIFQNTISGSDLNGILVEGGSNNTVGGVTATDGNTISNSGLSGVEISHSDGAKVLNNVISGNGDSGVRMDFSNNVTVNNNTIGNSSIDGIRAFDSHNLTADSNTISNIAGSGIGLANSNDGIFSNNVITNTGRGFWVGNSDRAQILNNTISNSGYGIWLLAYNDGAHGSDANGYASNDVTIKGNTINGGWYGVVIQGGADNTQVGGNTAADGNTIDGAAYDGVYADGATHLAVKNNTIKNVGNNGVTVINSAGANISNNSISNVGNTGIYIDPSPSTVVTGNNIVGGLVGVHVALDSDSSTVTSNIISGQTLYGVLVDGGSDDATVGANNINVAAGATGIRINGGNNHDVQSNTINGGTFGIILSGTGNNNDVVGNTIGQTTGTLSNAITVTGNTGLTNVLSNHVYNAGWDGIQVANGTGFVNILSNDIHNTTGASGIAILDHNGDALVDGNLVDGADRLGIYIQRSDGLVISDNTVNDTGREGAFWYTAGIHLEGADNTLVSGNTITNVNNGGDGIHVGGDGNFAAVPTTGNVISHNIIGVGAGAGNISGDGIDVRDSAGVQITSNTVQNVLGNGIFVDPSPNAVIKGNTINGVGLDGIHVLDSNNVIIGGFGAGEANTIDNVGDDGIELSNSDGAQVKNNKIGTNNVNGSIADDGITIGNGSDTANVVGNVIRADGRGISVFGGNNHVLNGNTISTYSWIDAQDEGIYAQNTTNIDIINNHLTPSIDNSGIVVSGGSNADVLNNDIHSSSPYGIEIDNVATAHVNGNVVNVSGTGIYAHGGSNITINNNDIFNVVNGIWADGVNTLWIDGNDIDANTSINAPASGGYGIVAINSNNVTIGDGNFSGDNGNEIDDFAYGIYAGNNTGYTTIDANDITDVNYGIYATNVATLKVLDNDINGRTGSGRGANAGIHVDTSASALIGGSGDGNTVRNFNGNGIELINSASSTINSNTVFNVGSNGIFVDPSPSTIVSFNNIYNTGANGVYILDSDNSQVLNNTIGTSGGANNIGSNGIYVSNSDNTIVRSNDVTQTVGNGILADLSNSVQISLNEIWNVDRDGIHVDGGVYADIWNNDIDNTGDDGIDVNGNNNVVIRSNDIHDTEGNGIEVSDSYNADIRYNQIDEVDEDGINVDNSDDADIYGNEINVNYGGANAESDGIQVSNSDGVEINDNRIDDVDDAGIELFNTDNVSVYRNYITDAHTGIRLNDSGINGANIDDNDIENVEYGIYADDVDNLSITDNDIDGRTGSGKGEVGIYVTDSFNAQIGGFDNSGPWWTWNSDGNTVEDFDTGIRVIDSFSADIEHNDVSEFTDYGIRVSDSAFVDVISNDVYDGDGTGIRVYNSNNAEINENNIEDVDGHGIELVNSDFVDIFDNNIEDVGQHGIYVDPSDFVDIAHNTISGAAWDGIHIDFGNWAEIWDNHIDDVGNDGIDVNDNDFVEIYDNHIEDADDNGIEVSDSFDAEIYDNEITGAGNDGINLVNSAWADIYGNVIFGQDGGFFVSGKDGAGRDGIHVENSAFVDITNNTIRGGNAGFFSIGGNGAGRDGIHVVNSFDADVTFNDIYGGSGFWFFGGSNGAGDDGIYVDNSAFADIRQNNVSDTGDDGIDVRNSFGVDIVRNDIDDTAGDGIQVRNSMFADILRNNVEDAGDDGIDVEFSDGSSINNNNVEDIDNNGIEVSFSDDVSINRNDIQNVDEDGINVFGGRDIRINDNNIAFIGDDGIDVSFARRVRINDNDIFFTSGDAIQARFVRGLRILDNFIRFAGDDGIDVENSRRVHINGNNIDLVNNSGIEISDVRRAEIANNNIGTGAFGYVGGNGIDIRDSQNVDVVSNNIGTNVQGSGIFIDPSFNISLIDNVINQVGGYGIYVQGAGNGLITLAGNTVNSRPGNTGARFESGQIDMTGASNTFNGGENGLEFDPGKGANDLSLVGDTFGTTVFNGQTGYYIALYNGAMFNPGTPTILDATQVSFDGFIGGGGIIDPATLAAIEAKLLDFDDFGTEGQIFFGFSATGLDQNELLPEQKLGQFASRFGGSVTIVGLPLANLNAVGRGVFGNLANIAPAAGGEPNDEEQASAFDLNSIDTAAGSETVNSWDGVYNHLSGQAGPVTFTLSAPPSALIGQGI